MKTCACVHFHTYYFSDFKKKFEWGLKFLIQFWEYKEILKKKKKKTHTGN